MSESDGSMHTVAVVGGGVGGLAVAFELKERSERLPGEIELISLEATGRTGGNIRTLQRDGFVCEWGPNGFLDNSPPTMTLIRRLGLQDRVLQAGSRAASRFVYREGKLREIPSGPRSLLTSDILPLSGKLRLLGEPLIPRRRDDSDESIYDFASRRIGRQAAAVLVDAMVTGICAGDVRGLSLPATFPKLHEMETKHGSLFRAMLARRRESRDSGGTAGGPTGPGGRLTSFRGGMQELTDSLAAAVGGSLHLNTRVTAVSDLGRRGFRVHRDVGAPMDVDAVVLACPSWRAVDLVATTDPEMSRAMSGISSAPLAVIHLGYREGSLGEMRDGFGFLVPRGQRVRILGTIWSSNVFEERAPAGSLLMTTMIGGAHDPEAVRLDDDELIRIVRTDLEKTMGALAPPYFVEIVRHERGIPQYTLGHSDRVALIGARLRKHPGLFVCGNSYRGISVNACVQEGPEIAENVLEHLSTLD